MNTYDYILDKINAMKTQYPSLRARTDDYIFSALCIKAHFYKNPALVLNESDFAEIIVDSTNDGGADILLSDPNSEGSDLVIAQSKFYKTISSEQVLNALRKMADFYKDMIAGHYEQFNSRVQQQFLTLNAEVGDESKIHFVFYTSAPKKGINTTRLERKFREQFPDSSAIEVSILFANDIADEIKESEARKPTVERGKIRIDETNNYLLYGDDAAIVNVSAFSIKELYAKHNINLLSLNLRYHINKGKNDKKVDTDILKTIKDNPESFWLKNNGITIICDDFDIDGREVHLENFSIVNGGQTTYLLDKSKDFDEVHDFYLSCKIIKNTGATTKDKMRFSLDIAEAANSQKAIKPADLRANAPEQRRFAQAMREAGIFYQTKRGEKVLQKYRAAYLHTKLEEVSKLCMAAIFQEPCKSRNNPSAAYKEDSYYNPIFNEKFKAQLQVAQICKELLYMDDYFRKKFLKKFDAENRGKPNAEIRIPFAHLSRTICIAFVALAARYHQGNITEEKLTTLTVKQIDSTALRKTLRDLDDMKFLLPVKLYTDSYDTALDKLFNAIISAGTKLFSSERRHNQNLTATNFMKHDKHYYNILNDYWEDLEAKIDEVFAAM